MRVREGRREEVLFRRPPGLRASGPAPNRESWAELGRADALSTRISELRVTPKAIDSGWAPWSSRSGAAAALRIEVEPGSAGNRVA